jgi:hypothetical protein
MVRFGGPIASALRDTKETEQDIFQKALGILEFASCAQTTQVAMEETLVLILWLDIGRLTGKDSGAVVQWWPASKATQYRQTFVKKVGFQAADGALSAIRIITATDHIVIFAMSFIPLLVMYYQVASSSYAFSLSFPYSFTRIKGRIQ